MNSRERVIAALRHEVPDRIPRDFGGTESSGITGMTYNRLRGHLGFSEGLTEIFDVYQQVVKIEDDIRVHFSIDTIPLHFEPLKWKPFTLPDGSPCHIPDKWNPVEENGDLVVRNEEGIVYARLPQGGFYFEPVYFPLADVTSPEELDAYTSSFESCDLPSFADETFEAMGARAKKMHEETDYAVVANFMVHLLAAGQLLRGFDNFFCDLMVNKPLAHGILERLVDVYFKRADEYFSCVGDHIDVVLVNDDLGTQTGPMMSLDCYREMILPYQKKLFSYIKEKTGAFLLLHSCGSVYQYIPDLIEAGVDALNPVQISAADMDSAKLKQEFGSDITFWGGGCDTQEMLNRGTPEQVKEEVKKRVRDFSPGGGFVFTQVHNIQPDVTPENIAAMFEALDEI